MGNLKRSAETRVREKIRHCDIVALHCQARPGETCSIQDTLSSRARARTCILHTRRYGLIVLHGKHATVVFNFSGCFSADTREKLEMKMKTHYYTTFNKSRKSIGRLCLPYATHRQFCYKIPYRRALGLPGECVARAKVSCIQSSVEKSHILVPRTC